jgi:hypothetical protein
MSFRNRLGRQGLKTVEKIHFKLTADLIIKNRLILRFGAKDKIGTCRNV